MAFQVLYELVIYGLASMYEATLERPPESRYMSCNALIGIAHDYREFMDLSHIIYFVLYVRWLLCYLGAHWKLKSKNPLIAIVRVRGIYCTEMACEEETVCKSQWRPHRVHSRYTLNILECWPEVTVGLGGHSPKLTTTSFSKYPILYGGVIITHDIKPA